MALRKSGLTGCSPEGVVTRTDRSGEIDGCRSPSTSRRARRGYVPMTTSPLTAVGSTPLTAFKV